MIGRRGEPPRAAGSPDSRTGRHTAGRQPRHGRGTLLIVAFMLLASAGLRMTETWGAATAFEAGGTEAPEPGTSEDTDPTPDFEGILASIAAREARVAEREARLDTRSEALTLAERRIDAKLQDLVAAEKDLRATIALSEKASENDLTQLTSVYANMGAEEAAALFGQMTPDFAAGFLGRMRPDIAAAILAGLDPTSAYEISVILAGRNALAPQE